MMTAQLLTVAPRPQLAAEIRKKQACLLATTATPCHDRPADQGGRTLAARRQLGDITGLGVDGPAGGGRGPGGDSHWPVESRLGRADPRTGLDRRSSRLDDDLALLAATDKTAFLVELSAQDGGSWTWGPPEVSERVSGPALDSCLLVTQRRHRDDMAVVVTGAQVFAGPPGAGRSAGQFA